jgi:chromosome segregation ATPase
MSADPRLLSEAELERVRGERDRLRKFESDVEEREAAVCPEDVGFDEYIRVLDKKLSEYQFKAFEQQERAESLQQENERLLKLHENGFEWTAHQQKELTNAEQHIATLEGALRLCVRNLQAVHDKIEDWILPGADGHTLFENIKIAESALSERREGGR